MSTNSTSEEKAREGKENPMSSALNWRRLAFVYAPLVSGLLIVAAFFLDPDIGASGRELAQAYAESPGRIQLSALALRFGFAFLIVPAFVLIALVRGRGAWLANVAGVFALLGMTTLPGFLVTDFYDVAIYGELGGDAWQQVTDRIEELPGAMLMFLSALIGFTLTLPVALLAAWRARLLPWWPALAVLLAEVSVQVVPGGVGLLVLAAMLMSLTYLLRRMTLRRPAREHTVVDALPQASAG
jgi:hypothetical protein